LLLRRMTRDLLLSHPSPENLCIVPTARDPKTSLALSSRNAYLTARERELAAPALHAALQAGKRAWNAGKSKADCLRTANTLIAETAERFRDPANGEEQIVIKPDYIEMNDPETFDVLPASVTRDEWEGGEGGEGRPVIFSGAMWVGRTRLIDNVILGHSKRLGIMD